MRLLYFDTTNEIRVSDNEDKHDTRYAILSHTWGLKEDEVTYSDIVNGQGKSKEGWQKIRKCGEQARRDGLDWFWVDTCCIDQTNSTELSEAITSMYRWYHGAITCYVHLADVGGIKHAHKDDQFEEQWRSQFPKSRWFQRGWTLQELLAPRLVQFYSRDWVFLGSKNTLEKEIHEQTNICLGALRGAALSQFSFTERLKWADGRKTTKSEDRVYSLLGIFDVSMPILYGEGLDRAVTRLAREIKTLQYYQIGNASAVAHGNKHSGALIDMFQDALKSADSARHGSSRNIHWNIARPSNSLFVGRFQLLKSVEEIVNTALMDETRTQPCRIVVTGIGGQGKSEICLQIANRARPICWGIFWVDVSKADLAEAGFADIAQRLGLVSVDVSTVVTSLADSSHPWLLILDNADDPDFDYQRYIPSGSQGVVLLTSRNRECQRYATTKHIELEGLDVSDGIHLLFKAAQITGEPTDVNENAAGKIVLLLQSHALALIQAGAYIALGYCTLIEYPAKYTRQKQRLLKFRPSQAQSRHGDVYATFEVPAQALSQSTDEAACDALQLLHMMAMGSTTPLPLATFGSAWHKSQGSRQAVPADHDTHISKSNSRDLASSSHQLTDWHMDHLPDVLHIEHIAWDQDRLIQAINILTALSLIHRNSGSDGVVISMHPLIRDWARERQELGCRQQSWITMACTIAASLQSTIRPASLGRDLQSYILALLSSPVAEIFELGPKEEILTILLTFLQELLVLRADQQLLFHLRSIFRYFQLNSDVVDPQWTALYMVAGRNLSDSGKPTEAVQVLKQVVEIRERTLRPEHPDRLASQHELAIALNTNGQHLEAITLLEHVAKVRGYILAREHSDRLASQQALAIAYEDYGLEANAVMLLEDIAEIHKQTLSEDHPRRLASQHSLARAYKNSGQAEKAVRLLEHVVNVRDQTLAEEHFTRLSSQHELAAAYISTGQIKKALALFEHVVEIRDQTLTEEHPSRLASQHALATVYLADGQVQRAITLLEHVVNVKDRTLVETHPRRLASQYHLAMALADNGQLSDATRLLEHVIAVQDRILPQDNRHQIRSRRELARLYSDRGQEEKSVVLLKQLAEVDDHTCAEQPH